MPGNTITRKEFYRLVLRAIALGQLFANGALDDAIEQVPPNPIGTVVAKAKRIIADYQPIREWLKQEPSYETAAPLATARLHIDELVDDLLLFTNANFKPSTTNSEEVRLLFEDRAQLGVKGDLLSEEELVRLTDGLVPVAVVRGLLADYRIRCNPENMRDGWSVFVENYMNVIIAA